MSDKPEVIDERFFSIFAYLIFFSLLIVALISAHYVGFLDGYGKVNPVVHSPIPTEVPPCRIITTTK